jgi:carbonic anhydrase
MKSHMKKHTLRSLVILITLILALSFLATSGAQRKPGSKSKAGPQAKKPQLQEDCYTDVDADTALNLLRTGNNRWSNQPMMTRNWRNERAGTAKCQRPFAIVIACMDSRVPPELIFDRGLGEIFVIRVAGPVLDNDQLASLEYALVHMNVKRVVVLGHTDCGAVKGAVAQEAAGPPGSPYLPGLLLKLQPAVTYVKNNYNHRDPISPDDETNVNRVSIANARDLAHAIPTFDQAGVKVTWGLYSTASGVVAFEPREPWLSSRK